jgi:hypothetical protein
LQILERQTRSTAIIEWCDSTACHYGQQLWRLSTAKQNGICAATGEAINPGDAVYRPQEIGERPINAGQMIHAYVIEIFVIEESA